MSTIEQRGLDETEPLAAPGKALLAEWNQRRTRGLHERHRYEPTWSMCEHFLAGRQWVGWASTGSRTGRVVEERNPQKRERHTVNVLTQYVQTVLGKIYSEDLRPTLVFTRDDIESASIAENARNVARFLWDSELSADVRLYDAFLKMLTYGTSAVRCYFDTSKGPEIGEFPIGPDGQPILDPQEARAYVYQAQLQGQSVRFLPLKEGKIVWESLGPRSLVTPPGVDNEEDFPWLIIERAMPVEWAKMKYPRATGELRGEDLITLASSSVSASVLDAPAASPATSGKLLDHLIVSTGYEMPSAKYPSGRTVTWNAKSNVILDIQDSLPYKLHNEPHHGVVFLHYHRLPHRFFSIGVVEPLIGPQRQKNRARSQMIEMKDRNLGRVYAKKGTVTAVNKPTGAIMELIEIPLHADFPQETQGVPPGPWIENEARINDEDMDRVAGLGSVSLGQAPQGVAAYSAMALLAEQDERRVGPIMKRLRISIGDALVLGLELAKRYWQDDKQMAIVGPGGEMELFLYKRAAMPLEFYVDVSRHSPLPTSPAVESQKIFDIYNAAIGAGQPLPISWLKGSLEQGRAMEIPKGNEETQASKAELENMFLAEGQMMVPEYYDDDYIHITVHRTAQIEHAANPQAQQLIEQHILMHAQNAAMKKPTSADAVPSMQGGHGVEAQNGRSANMQGVAQAPGVMPRGGMAQGG